MTQKEEIYLRAHALIGPWAIPEELRPPEWRFPLGRIAATPGARQALLEADTLWASLLVRHVRGDWGDLDEHDRNVNEEALANGARLLSAYALPSGERIWVITEADRSVTTFLLPEEY